MTTITENDLKELKDLINERFNQINQRFEQVDKRFEQVNERFDKVDKDFEQVNERITELRINQEKIQTRLEDWKPSIDKTADLSEKIGELKNWRQLGLILLTGIFTSLLWIFKARI